MLKVLDLKELCSWIGGADSPVRLARAKDQHQVANIDDRSDALSCDEDRVFPIDRIGECNEPAYQAHVPKRDRDLTLRLFFRGNPLDHPSSEKQPLAKKSDGEPDSLDAHNGTVMRDGRDAREAWDAQGSRFSRSRESRLSCISRSSRLPDRHLSRNVYRSTLVCIHRTAIKS